MNCHKCDLPKTWLEPSSKERCGEQCPKHQVTELLQPPVKATILQCPVCYSSKENLMKTSYVGCPACYELFSDAISDLVKPVLMEKA